MKVRIEARPTGNLLISVTILIFLLSVYNLFIFNKPNLQPQEHIGKLTLQKLSAYQEIKLKDPPGSYFLTC